MRSRSLVLSICSDVVSGSLTTLNIETMISISHTKDTLHQRSLVLFYFLNGYRCGYRHHSSKNVFKDQNYKIADQLYISGESQTVQLR